MEPIEIGKHLIIHPNVCFGKLTFKGTRVPVQTVLVFMTLEGYTVKRIQESWPYLKREAIKEAIRLGAVAWPELMQEKAAEALKRLATPRRKRDSNGRATRARTATEHVMAPIEIGPYLVLDPGICSSKLMFKGTRLSVETVVGFMALKDYTYEDVLKRWPYLNRKAVEDALRLMAGAWPELLRPAVEDAVRRLGEPLRKVYTAWMEETDEPTRSGRTH